MPRELTNYGTLFDCSLSPIQFIKIFLIPERQVGSNYQSPVTFFGQVPLWAIEM